jgi:O-antigen/teichoic acid export membrane protein
VAAAANIALDFLLVPYFGMFGAAWASVSSLGLLVLLGGVLAHRNFPLWVPPGEVARILCASAVMAVALIVMPVPENWIGLVLLIAGGALTYGVIAVVVDLAGVRGALQRRFRQRVAVSAES